MSDNYVTFQLAKKSLKVQLFLFFVGAICAVWVKLDSGPQIGSEIIILMWSLFISVAAGALVVLLGLASSMYLRNIGGLKLSLISCVTAVASVVLAFMNMGWGV